MQQMLLAVFRCISRGTMCIRIGAIAVVCSRDQGEMCLEAEPQGRQSICHSSDIAAVNGEAAGKTISAMCREQEL